MVPHPTHRRFLTFLAGFFSQPMRFKGSSSEPCSASPPPVISGSSSRLYSKEVCYVLGHNCMFREKGTHPVNLLIVNLLYRLIFDKACSHFVFNHRKISKDEQNSLTFLQHFFFAFASDNTLLFKSPKQAVKDCNQSNDQHLLHTCHVSVVMLGTGNMEMNKTSDRF